MSQTYSLNPTSFYLAINGQEIQTQGNVSIPGPIQYLFSPAALTNGTGKGLALRGYVVPIVLPAVAAPTGAPTLGQNGSGGSITAGTYTLQFAWFNANGITIGSATAQIVVASGTTNQVTVTAPVSLVSGATGIKAYMTATSGPGAIGLVGSANANTVTLNTLAGDATLPSATLNSATLALSIDLTSASAASATLQNAVDYFNSIATGNTTTGINFSLNGAGSAGNGVKLFWLEPTDTTSGQTLKIDGTVSNAWTNGVGTGTTTINASPAGWGWYDAVGRAVASGNKILSLLAKYNTPTVNLIIAGEGQ
jgi:hypothetical protein